jgi:succinate dehydrogenase/fumarate reductase flavoprotein subunit
MLDGVDPSNHVEPIPMYANFAAGTLIVLGVLITVLGLFAAGEMVVVVVGLAAVLAGGMLGALAARQPA